MCPRIIQYITVRYVSKLPLEDALFFKTVPVNGFLMISKSRKNITSKDRNFSIASNYIFDGVIQIYYTF